MIYLDSAATTKPKQEVIKVIQKSLDEDWCNPSARYTPSLSVRKKVEKAREVIAGSINAEPEEIFFTSSGSEANSWVIKCAGSIQRVIVSDVEHHSIHDAVRQCFHYKNIGTLPVDYTGYLKRDHYRNSLDKFAPCLISVLYVNNETGTVQNIKDLTREAQEKDFYFHTDAVQAFPHHKIDVKYLGVDYMTVSGHKFGAPKGSGFLYAKRGAPLAPLINGTQENNLRGGTENVPYILGLAKAVELRNTDISTEMQSYFETGLKQLGCKINCEDAIRSETITSCMLPEDIVAELVIYMLGFCGIYCSAGSACNASSNEQSHVLKAIGLLPDEIQRTIRFSLPDDITKEQLDITLDALSKNIQKIRG